VCVCVCVFVCVFVFVCVCVCVCVCELLCSFMPVMLLLIVSFTKDQLRVLISDLGDWRRGNYEHLRLPDESTFTIKLGCYLRKRNKPEKYDNLLPE